ncbi:MAG: hypothetical protein QM642_04710 [Edaphocola sp.]
MKKTNFLAMVAMLVLCTVMCSSCFWGVYGPRPQGGGRHHHGGPGHNNR